MYNWKVVISVWPHSTGRGNSVDQKQAGARDQTYDVNAESMKDAFQLAEVICIGLRQNPIVWKTPIQSIVRDGYASGNHLVKCMTERTDAYTN